MTCCGLAIGLVRDTGSPFTRCVSTGYYDGPTDGLVECGVCATVYVFTKVDWDDLQDVRVFALAPIADRTFAELDRVCTPSWPFWMPTVDSGAPCLALLDEFVAAAGPAEFVVATDDLLRRIIVSRPLGPTPPHTGWLEELGLDRAGKHG